MIGKTNAVGSMLKTDDATATPETILEGYTAYVKDEKIEGTIPKYQGESENAEIKASKVASLVDGTITEITDKDLAGITSLRERAFSDCRSLTSVTLPNSITNISASAFYYCTNLTNIPLHNGITNICSYSFYNCSSLAEVVIPNSVSKIDQSAYNGCTKLSKFTLGSGVTTMGSGVFSNTFNIKTVNYLGTLEKWCKISFNDSPANPCWNSADLYINDVLLTNADIPNTITEIKKYAFYNCRSLISITIPASVTKIGSSALQIGSNASKATIRMLSTTPPQYGIQSNTFNKSYLEKIIVPKGCKAVYLSNTTWADFEDYIVESEIEE